MCHKGCSGLVLGLLSSLENILKAENVTPSHLYSYTSTNDSAPLSFAPLTEIYCIYGSFNMYHCQKIYRNWVDVQTLVHNGLPPGNAAKCYFGRNFQPQMYPQTYLQYRVTIRPGFPGFVPVLWGVSRCPNDLCKRAKQSRFFTCKEAMYELQIGSWKCQKRSATKGIFHYLQ